MPAPLPPNTAFVIVGNPPEQSSGPSSPTPAPQPATMTVYLVDVVDEASMDGAVEVFVNTLDFPLGTGIYAVFNDHVHRYDSSIKLAVQ